MTKTATAPSTSAVSTAVSVASQTSGVMSLGLHVEQVEHGGEDEAGQRHLGQHRGHVEGELDRRVAPHDELHEAEAHQCGHDQLVGGEEEQAEHHRRLVEGQAVVVPAERQVHGEGGGQHVEAGDGRPPQVRRQVRQGGRREGPQRRPHGAEQCADQPDQAVRRCSRPGRHVTIVGHPGALRDRLSAPGPVG